MNKIHLCTVKENKKISSDIYDITLVCPDVAEIIKAGQFISIYLDNGEHILPRPITICEIGSDGTLRIIFKIVGQGTKIISEFKKDKKVKILAPLGNSFTISQQDNKFCLVGYGMGVPPLLELLKEINKTHSNPDISVFIGFQTEPMLENDFKKYGAKVYVSTEDGRINSYKNILDLIYMSYKKFDVIYSCGPKTFLKDISKLAEETNTKCYVTIHERMACSIGTCIGCVTKIKNGDDFIYKKVCKDGPIFNSTEVVWE